MNDTNKAVQAPPKQSALMVMGSRYSVEPSKLMNTLKATVFRGATDEEMMSLVVVANEYGLNPFLREIYAFPKKGGGIQPVVGIDGWLRLMNGHPQFDGIEYEWSGSATDSSLECTAIIHRKDRKYPVKVTEFMGECYRKTEPWDTWPRRMLRHRATIQAARIAFGFTGLGDEDEVAASQFIDVQVSPADPPKIAEPKPDPKPEPKPAGDPVGDLMTVVLDGGHTFDDFRLWAAEMGHIADAESIAQFSDVPKDVAARLLRNRSGMLNQLAARKAGQ